MEAARRVPHHRRAAFLEALALAMISEDEKGDGEFNRAIGAACETLTLRLGSRTA